MVTHWFDFVCPFCYIAQQRNDVLREAGVEVVELPYVIHPEIGPAGAPAPVRQGPMYEHLRVEAERAGLPLSWSPRLAYSRPALVRAEIVRRADPRRHVSFCREVFDAYFGRGLDIASPELLDQCALAAGVPAAVEPKHEVTDLGEQDFSVSVRAADQAGVRGTPAWLVSGRLITGLQPVEAFVELAEQLRS